MSIQHEIMIEAPVDVVWRTVTEPEHIGQWFGNAAEIDVREGGEGKLTWTDRASKELKEAAVAHLTVETVEPPHLFSYRWAYPDGEKASEENSVLVEFRLTPEGGGTRLRVTETGLEGLGWTDEQKAAYAEEHEQGWLKHLGDLASYVAEVATK